MCKHGALIYHKQRGLKFYRLSGVPAALNLARRAFKFTMRDAGLIALARLNLARLMRFKFYRFCGVRGCAVRLKILKGRK